jgi:hypothetical protein
MAAPVHSAIQQLSPRAVLVWWQVCKRGMSESERAARDADEDQRDRDADGPKAAPIDVLELDQQGCLVDDQRERDPEGDAHQRPQARRAVDQAEDGNSDQQQDSPQVMVDMHAAGRHVSQAGSVDANQPGQQAQAREGDRERPPREHQPAAGWMNVTQTPRTSPSFGWRARHRRWILAQPAAASNATPQSCPAPEDVVAASGASNKGGQAAHPQQHPRRP